jgi:N-acetyl-gamma-glutamylphosphate reductase
MKNPEVHIVGPRGNIGSDLAKVLTENNIPLSDTPQDANIIALCVPSKSAKEILEDKRYEDKIVIDFSGAAKRRRLGQYGLMLSETEPWDSNFDKTARVFGNPGCIASAAILGMHAAGLSKELPQELSIFSIGGKSHVHDIDDQEIKLGRRLRAHPHVNEFQTAFDGLTRINSFMPSITAGVENGLLVGISGKTQQGIGYDIGTRDLRVSDVVGTDKLQHRLELNAYGNGYNIDGFDFSLGVVIDNLRFVTANAVKLITYIRKD